nr:Chain B, Cell Division Protein Ftsz [Haloferax volcanii]
MWHSDDLDDLLGSHHHHHH